MKENFNVIEIESEYLEENKIKEIVNKQWLKIILKYLEKN